MPILDKNHYLLSGKPISDKASKYINDVGKDGNIVGKNIKDLNLQYNSLYNIMKEHNRIETLERYMWLNVPFGLTADLIERILYYRGKGIFYFNDNVGKFQFLPFALNKTIDEYGRYTSCNTLPFIGVDSTDEKQPNGKKKANQSLVYENLDIVYDLPYTEEDLININQYKTVGIILNDSSLGLSQQPIIRSNYVQPVLHLMATVMQLINTAIFGAADHSLIQIENEAEYDSVVEQIEAINQDILLGNRYSVITGSLPINPIKTSNTADLEGLFGTFNSLSNFLKSITGVANAGVFDKKAHLLQEEQALNGSNADDVYYNGLRQRQEFCLMVQAYYRYPIWCESKREMSGAQEENYLMGETEDPDNTQFNTKSGGEEK